MRNTMIAVSLAALLAGCAGQTVAPTVTQAAAGAAAATSSPAAPSDPLSQLASFTVADLQAASADAKAQTPPDVAASQCYDFLAGMIPTLPHPGAGSQTIGAVLLFQKARDLANGATSVNGQLKGLNLACAALAFDVNATLIKIGLISAGTAATGGALAPALPGLGAALGATLPISIP